MAFLDLGLQKVRSFIENERETKVSVTPSHVAESHSALHFQNLKNLRYSLGNICLDFKHRTEKYNQARKKAMGF